MLALVTEPAEHPSRRELFDAWSADYDPAADDAFPFGAYEDVLDRVAELVAQRRPRRVLELGVGTGNLTRRILERLPGVSFVAVDFSHGMAARVEVAVPGIELVDHDVAILPLPPETRGCDVAAMTYVLHEFSEEHQLRLLASLVDGLQVGGACVIGDVCFADADARDAARSRLGTRWDPEEHYLAADELGASLGALGLRVEAEQLGPHAGVLEVDRDG
jgi:putative AdoMet-dependent methyltransferase